MLNWKICLIVALQLWYAEVSKGWFFARDDNCYDSPNVGCFPTTGHFTNSMGFAPQSPQEVGVQFLYKASSGPDVAFTVDQTQQAMRDVFNPSLKTVLIIHGYLESPRRPWLPRMADALKRKEPMNLFVVDWEDGALNINYLQCVANARMAGAITGLFLQELIDHLGASPSTFHVIGFSLGAQVAGYVGERVRGIGRITGLDPAGPGFVDTHPTVRLDPTDAAVVDVIHTDKDMGTLMPMGTIDFYPNGGADQPSCGYGAMSRISSFMSQFGLNSQLRIILTSAIDLSRNSLTRTVGCSHIRATELFTSSINVTCSYSLLESINVRNMRNVVGSPCQDDTCPTFGYNMDFFRTPRPGIFRFPTGGFLPYCCE